MIETVNTTKLIIFIKSILFNPKLEFLFSLKDDNSVTLITYTISGKPVLSLDKKFKSVDDSLNFLEDIKYGNLDVSDYVDYYMINKSSKSISIFRSLFKEV